MSAKFVAHALSYCLARGSISLRGQKRRPWLEIVRSETESRYHQSQMRQLKKSCQSPLDVVWDVVATDGFYDKQRLRLQSDELYRAYELLYPRDRKLITTQVMEICGLLGMTALWSDAGSIVGQRGRLRPGLSLEEARPIYLWCNDHGFACSPGLLFSRDSTKALIKAIRPQTHLTMRRKFVNERKKPI